MYKVMLVDDEYLMRNALKIIISDIAGFQVVGEAQNGREALTLSAELSPDLIFMDIMMYGMNGLEVSEIIKKQNPNVVIIILTAYSEFEFAKKAMQIGISHYLLKPFSLQEINHIIALYRETHLDKASLVDHFVKNLCRQIGYAEAYNLIGHIVKHIYASTDNIDGRYREFRALLLALINLITGIEKAYKSHYEKKFCIDENICRDSMLAEFWLFEVIDEVFKQRSIQVYPQFIKVFSYIEEKMNIEISLEAVSLHADLSISYLSRIFKKAFGTHFSNYVNLKKINKSKQILKARNMTINDVAFEVGYNEPNYYCKVFKKLESVTPSQYREHTRSSH